MCSPTTFSLVQRFGLWLYWYYWVLFSFLDHYSIRWQSLRRQTVPGNGACLQYTQSSVHLKVQFETKKSSAQNTERLNQERGTDRRRRETQEDIQKKQKQHVGRTKNHK